MRRVILALGVLVALVMSASAAPILLVDHFDDGTFYSGGTVSPLTNANSMVPPGDYRFNLNGVIGPFGVPGGSPPGERDVTMTFIPHGSDVFQTYIFNSTLNFGVPSGDSANLVLTYGSYASGAVNLNADVKESDFLGFDVSFSDLAGALKVELNTGTGVYHTKASLTIPAGGKYFALPNFSFWNATETSVMPQSALGDLDGLRFTFTSTNQAWDFTLEAIQFTTPEPATMSLLGLGILALVRRRRKA